MLLEKEYDHYIGLDWAKKNMAIARLTKEGKKAEVLDLGTNLKVLKTYLENLRGSIAMTIEETSTSQWLYTELFEHVEKLVICNPSKNKLMQKGPKTDKIDANNLAMLLKNNLLEPVFHDNSEYIKLRKLVSGYNSIIKNGVRLKNQRAGLLLSKGKEKNAKDLDNMDEKIVFQTLSTLIDANNDQVKVFEKRFKELQKMNKRIKDITSIPGFDKNSVKLVAIVVNPERFKNKGSWLSYCGLVKHEKLSGGRSYGKRMPVFCRDAKSIMKTAAMACINSKSNNPFKQYYLHLIYDKHYATFNARHAVARKIAVVALGVMKSGKRFKSKLLEVTNEIK